MERNRKRKQIRMHDFFLSLLIASVHFPWLISVFGKIGQCFCFCEDFVKSSSRSRLSWWNDGDDVCFFFFFRELHNCIYKICKDCCCVSMRYLLNKESNHIYKKKLGKKITSTVSKCLTDSVDLWLYKRLIRYLDKHTHKVLSDAKKSDRMTIAVLTAGYSEHSLESTTISIEDKNCKQYFIPVDWVRKLLIKMGKRQHQKDKM